MQATLGPESVLAALDLQARAFADVLLEDLAVVAHVLDDTHSPVVGQADGLTELALGAEQAFDLRVLGGLHLLDVGLGDAELLGIEHGIVRPPDDVSPLVVAVADCRAKRLLGDDLWQNDVIVRVRDGQTRGIEAGDVSRHRIAAAGLVGFLRLRRVCEAHHLIGHVVGPEVVGEVQLGRGALVGADRLAVEFLGRGHTKGFADHEALAVEVVDRRELETELGVARHGRGRVAGQHVNLPRLQRREAVLSREGNELYLGRVVEDGRCDGTAEVNVET